MTDFDQWANGLTIVGDEAFLPGQHVPGRWHRLTDEEREHYHRDWNRRRRADPEYYARELARKRERERAQRAEKRAAA